ncbi:hypothetical protein ADL05_10150 [Nocardiopsis sp. NRRL B-16309]|nr:hypothetical protein ADL05_10150 [Nocardiopsis sp. NRRL B-16309]
MAGLLGLGLHLLAGRDSVPVEWRVTEFDAQVTVHASGSVDMVETITYDFGDQPSHGLTRELPETGWIDDYGWRDLGLTDVRADGANGLPVEISAHAGDPREESQTVVRVGDFEADPVLTGEHVFEISYTYERLTTPGGDGGARYYADIVGTGWRVPIESATAALHLPDLAEAGEGGGARDPHDEIDAACYAGDAGERGDCVVFTWADPDSDPGDPLLTARHRSLSPGQAMSVRLSLPPSVYSADRTGEDEGAARPDPPYDQTRTVIVGLGLIGCLGGLVVGSSLLVERYFPDTSASGRGSRVGGGGVGGAGGGGGGGGG